MQTNIFGDFYMNMDKESVKMSKLLRGGVDWCTWPKKDNILLKHLNNKINRLCIYRMICLQYAIEWGELELKYDLYLWIDMHIPLILYITRHTNISRHQVRSNKLYPCTPDTFPICEGDSIGKIIKFKDLVDPDNVTDELIVTAQKTFPRRCLSRELSHRATRLLCVKGDQRMFKILMQMCLGNYRHCTYRPRLAKRLELYKHDIKSIQSIVRRSEKICAYALSELVAVSIEDKKPYFNVMQGIMDWKENWRNVKNICDNVYRRNLHTNQVITKEDIELWKKQHRQTPYAKEKKHYIEVIYNATKTVLNQYSKRVLDTCKSTVVAMRYKQNKDFIKTIQAHTGLGKNTCSIYKSLLKPRLKPRKSISKKLKQAVESGQLTLDDLGVVANIAKKIVGVENVYHRPIGSHYYESQFKYYNRNLQICPSHCATNFDINGVRELKSCFLQDIKRNFISVCDICDKQGVPTVYIKMTAHTLITKKGAVYMCCKCGSLSLVSKGSFTYTSKYHFLCNKCIKK